MVNSRRFPAICIAVLFFATLLAPLDSYSQYPGFSDPGVRVAGGKGDGFVPVEQSIDGGTIPIGATAQVVARFRNDGSQPIQTGLIRLYPSSTISASTSMNQCEEEPLPAGAECAIAFSIKGLQAGPWRLEMLMTHSGRTRLVTTTLAGLVETTGEGADKLSSDIEAIPDELDFGTLDSNQTLIEPIILRNITSIPINISDIYIDTSEQAGYSLKTECKKLDPGQACIAVITWSPKLSGRSSGVLVIEHDGPAALASVNLSGEYNPENSQEADVFPQAVPGKGLLVSSQTDINFGGAIETASALTVSLVNAGDTSVKINDIRISGSDNGLGFKENGCVPGTILEPIEACPLTVTWSPTRVGPVLDDVQILHDGARGVLVLPVRGEASATVSQDQKAIVLSETLSTNTVNYKPSSEENEDTDESIADQQEEAAKRNTSVVTGKKANVSGVLDGYKITSFSKNRAIINGPGGSRIVFDGEEIVIGGVPWHVVIQKNGIEFLFNEDRVLLLFDRSLSSINRVTSSSNSNSGGNSSSNPTLTSNNTN